MDGKNITTKGGPLGGKGSNPWEGEKKRPPPPPTAPAP